MQQHSNQLQQQVQYQQNSQHQQSSDLSNSYSGSARNEGTADQVSSEQVLFQAGHVKFKSLGSIEEESPRWTHPPQPHVNSGREALQTVPSAAGAEFRGLLAASDGSRSTSQDDRLIENDAYIGGQKNSALQFGGRHVQSQPALVNETSGKESRRVLMQFQLHNPQQYLQQRNADDTEELATQNRQRPPLPPGYGNLLTGINNNGRNGPQASASSPVYGAGDSQNILSGRNPSSGSGPALFHNFIDRLFTREKVALIADELRWVENMLMANIARDLPDLHQQVISEREEESKETDSKSHFAVLEATLAQAKQLREIFAKFQNRRNEVHSFNQIMDGIQMDLDEASQYRRFTLGANGALQSTDSLPEKLHQAFHLHNDESTINHIKMGSAPSERQKTSSSGGTHKQNYDSKENFMVQIIRQQEQDIAQCNAAVEKFKSESADLELTIVDQRSEIQNLCNKLKQAHQRKDGQDQVQVEKREAENIVLRLKDELRSSQQEGSITKQHLKETGEVITNLQGQITALKHRLVLAEDASRNQHSHEFQSQAHELAELRQQNSEINSRFHDMAHSVQQKELELEEMEEKSKQMLIAAQKDAQECIQYFKTLAFQAGRERIDEQTARSHSPLKARHHIPIKIHQQATAVRTPTTSFPANLGPITYSRRPQDKAFRPSKDGSEYVVNGITLKMNGRAVVSTTENGAEGQSRRHERQAASQRQQQQRAQTLSPLPSNHTREDEPSKASASGRVRAPRHPGRGRDGSPFSGSIGDAGAITGHEHFLAQLRLQQAEMKLEGAMNGLVEAFQEISESKHSIATLVSNFGEQYCSQLQKFSVLAYDYLERIDTLVKRETVVQEEVRKQSALVDQLKQVAAEQAEHINLQNQLIQQQMEQSAAQQAAHSYVIDKQDKEFSRLGKLYQEECPVLRDTVMASHVAVLEKRKTHEASRQETAEIRHLLDLSKKKAKILEEELEKSLQASQSLEDAVAANKKKFSQLVDLIKDIWQEEVQNTTASQPLLSLSQHNGSGGPPVQAATQGNHGDTGTARVQTMIRPETASDLTQTLRSGTTANRANEVPMPISWLSDISEHIKTLKEMNDFQTDEVFQIVNMLHNSGGNPSMGQKALDTQNWTRNGDSNSTEEEEEDKSCEDSGISQNYQQAQDYDENTFREVDQEAYMQELPQEVEESETERGLAEYHEEQRIRLGVSEANGLYSNPTSTTNQVPTADYLSQDKKEMSFSQRIEEERRGRSQVVVSGARGRRLASHSHTGRQTYVNSTEVANEAPVNVATGRRDRSHNPSRNYIWPDGQLLAGNGRAVETQRVGGTDKHRRSFNVTSNRRWTEAVHSDNAGGAGSQKRPQNSPLPLARKNYRVSIDMTATVATMAAEAGNNKRNELYTMLREQVLDHLRQKEVGKDTIVGMKAQLRERAKELEAAELACRVLQGEKEGVVETRTHLETEVRDLELQIEELQGVVTDREASMENLKMQIEDFEKELMGLQDQMTHVMKLNSEIGMASEHWERSYHQLKGETEQEQAQQREDFKRQVQEKIDKIKQLKRKLQEKEQTVRALQQDLAVSVADREEVEARRAAMVSSSTMTEPAMELLEQHKDALEVKLGQVKQDVMAVLDQVEKEQVEKGQINAKLEEQVETNKNLIGELSQKKKALKDSSKEVKTLQSNLQASLAEVAKVNDSMEQDQEHFREQIEKANQINSDLQQQVEQVTRAAEELQEQMAGHYQTNDGLIHNAEIQEQKINQLEDQLLYYQRQLREKKQRIASLEQEFAQSKRQSKRETRSVSVPRADSKNSASGMPASGATTNKINQSALVNQKRARKNTSNSKTSSVLGGPHAAVREIGAFLPNDDYNNTIQTSQSIFDEAPLHTEDFAGPNRRSHPDNNDYQTQHAHNYDQFTQHEALGAHPSAGRLQIRPPRIHHKNSRQTTPTPPINASTRHCDHVAPNDRVSCTQDTSVGLETSALVPMGRTQAGISTKPSESRLGSRNSRQATRVEGGRMTAIDDLQSSYKQFKVRQEMGKDAKRKVKRAMQMTETLVRYYLSEAKGKLLEQTRQKAQITSDDSSSYLGEDLQRQQIVMNVSESTTNKAFQISEDEGLEAQAYLLKRSPILVNCLKELLKIITSTAHAKDHWNYLPAADDQPHEQVIKQLQKEPPQIVSHRGYLQQQVATEDVIDKQRRGTAGKQNSVDLSPQNGPDTVNLVIQGQFSGQPASETHVMNKETTPSNNLQNQHVFNTLTTAIGLQSLKSPASCTATFQQTQSMTNDLASHSKLLFQKFIQTGRSLAGICYGGCMFMQSSAQQAQRQKVDYALAYLAKDSSEFDCTSNQSIEELWKVIDSLLMCLSQVIQESVQNSMRANNQAADQIQAFGSIAQKSDDLSMDPNKALSRMGDAESSSRPNLLDDGNQHHVSSVTTTQVTGKLQDLEQKIKQKFSNINQLEALLDSILGKPKDQKPSLILQLVNDANSLQRVFANIKRVVSKLKIELHQDYLHLGQVNLHFQMSTTSAGRLDHNASIATASDFGANQMAHNRLPSPKLQPMIHRQPQMQAFSGAQNCIKEEVLNQDQYLVHPVIVNQGGTTSREPAQTSSTCFEVSTDQQPVIASVTTDQVSQEVMAPPGLHLQQNYSIGRATTSYVESGGTLSSLPSNPHLAQMNSARLSSNSGNTAQKLAARNAHVDRIVEELQSLNFEPNR